MRNAEGSARFGNEKVSDVEVESPFIKFYVQKIEEVRSIEE
jgi:hypothetical protein